MVLLSIIFKKKNLKKFNFQDTEEGCDDPSKDEEGGETRREPTPWQELDIKTLKVTDLREELQARGLNSKGLKSQLVGR